MSILASVDVPGSGFGLEVGSAIAGEGADDPGEDGGSDDGNDDAHDEAVLADAAEAKTAGDEASDESAARAIPASSAGYGLSSFAVT